MRLALAKILEHRVETNWSMAGPIRGDPDWAGGTVLPRCPRSRRERTCLRRIPRRLPCGGGLGWYATDWLWKIRGWIDYLAGGPGLRRGRRDPETVGYGEALDFWRVTGFERNRRLALRAK